MTEDVASLLEEPASKNAVLARVLRHVQDKPVCPRPQDFWTALKHSPDLVVRLAGDRPGEPELPMDYRVRNGAAERTHEHRDREVTGRDQFVDAVRDASSVEVRHHEDSHFADDPDPAPQVRADGSGEASFDDVALDAVDEARLDLDVLVDVHLGVDWTVVPGIETETAARWTTQLQQALTRLQGDPWTCYDCGAASYDPESSFVRSRNEVRVTCPECGAVDEIPQGSEPPREPRHDQLMTDGGVSTSGTSQTVLGRYSGCDYPPNCPGRARYRLKTYAGVFVGPYCPRHAAELDRNGLAKSVVDLGGKHSTETDRDEEVSG